MCRSQRSLSGGDIDGMDNHMPMFEELKRLIYGVTRANRRCGL